MLKLKMTGKNSCHGILKLRLIKFVEDGFKLWYNSVNENSICGYGKPLLNPYLTIVRKAKVILNHVIFGVHILIKFHL